MSKEVKKEVVRPNVQVKEEVVQSSVQVKRMKNNEGQ